MVTKANKKALFVMLMDCPSIQSMLKPVFLPNAGDSLYLIVTQVPRPRDMVVFVLMTTKMTTRPITLSLAHARGVTNDLAGFGS